MENLKAVQDNIIVKNIESEDKSEIIAVDFHDQTNLKGVVTSVGPEVENVAVGDVIIHTDSVREIVNPDPNVKNPDIFYIMKEDAIYCRVK